MAQGKHGVRESWSIGRILAAFLLVVTVAIGAALVFLPVVKLLERILEVVSRFASTYLGIENVTPHQYEFILNIVLFAVPVFLLSKVFPRVWWWVWVLLGMAISAGIELAQARWMVEQWAVPRSATWSDWYANSLGALIGAVLGAIRIQFRRPKPRRAEPV